MPYDVSRGPHKIYGVHGAQRACLKLKSSRRGLSLRGVSGTDSRCSKKDDSAQKVNERKFDTNK